MAHFTHKKLGQAMLDKPEVVWGNGGGCHRWQTDCECLEAPDGQKKQRESCLVEYTAWCMGGVDAGIKAKGLDMTEEGRKSLFFVFSCVVDPAGKLVSAGSVKPRQNVE